MLGIKLLRKIKIISIDFRVTQNLFYIMLTYVKILLNFCKIIQKSFVVVIYLW